MRYLIAILAIITLTACGGSTMAGEQLTALNFTGVNNQGDYLPYGKVYIYNSDGTLGTSYKTSALVTENTNPVILSVSGNADIYLKDGNYKIKLTDSNNNTIRETDSLIVENGKALEVATSLGDYIELNDDRVATVEQDINALDNRLEAIEPKADRPFFYASVKRDPPNGYQGGDYFNYIETPFLVNNFFGFEKIDCSEADAYGRIYCTIRVLKTGLYKININIDGNSEEAVEGGLYKKPINFPQDAALVRFMFGYKTGADAWALGASNFNEVVQLEQGEQLTMYFTSTIVAKQSATIKVFCEFLR